jgi:hypothetical protein
MCLRAYPQAERRAGLTEDSQCFSLKGDDKHGMQLSMGKRTKWTECRPTGCGKSNQKWSSLGKAVNSEGMANYTNPQKWNQAGESVCVLLGVKRIRG